MPIVISRKILIDQFSEDGDIKVSERVGYDIVGHRRHKYHRDPGNDAGHGQGESNARKYRKFISPQIGGRLQIAVVQLFKRGIQGQDHKRQKIVHHSDNGIQIIVRPEQAYQIQKFAQCGDAQYKIDPHRHNEEHEQNIFLFEFAARQNIGEGIGYEKTDCSRDYGDGKAHQQRRKFCGACKKIQKVRKTESYRSVGRFGKSIKENKQHGDYDKQRQKQAVRNAQLFA